MELDQKVAEVTIDPRTKEMIKIDVHRSSLKFKCQRCAVFCCKLGPPPLLPGDTERLKQAGVDIGRFFNSELTSLRTTKEGFCSLMSVNIREGTYKCSIYDLRPALCRLYPFRFEKSGPHSYALKFIPCCNGLNRDDGESVDGRFFAQHLRIILDEMIKSNVV